MSMAARLGAFAGGVLLGAGGGALWVKSRTLVVVPAASDVRAPTPPPGAGAAEPIVGVSPPSDTSDALRLSERPGPVSDVLQHIAYVSAYDRRLRHPAWTAEHLTADSIRRPPGSESPNRMQSIFTEDIRIPEQFRALNSDFFRSGYDRGHMVPAADAKQSQDAMNQTFLLSNIAPQVGPGMNRDYWAHTEDFMRRLTSQFEDVYVFTVPLYLPHRSVDGKWRVTYEVIGSPPNVSVPTHFAKVVLGVGAGPHASMAVSKLGLGQPLALGAFVIPNSMIPDSAPLRSFETSVDTVERAAGLTLFSPALKRQAKSLCSKVKCEIIVRDFSDAKRRLSSKPAAPGAIPGRPVPTPTPAPSAAP